MDPLGIADSICCEKQQNTRLATGLLVKLRSGGKFEHSVDRISQQRERQDFRGLPRTDIVIGNSYLAWKVGGGPLISILRSDLWLLPSGAKDELPE